MGGQGGDGGDRGGGGRHKENTQPARNVDGFAEGARGGGDVHMSQQLPERLVPCGVVLTAAFSSSQRSGGGQ